MKERLLVYCYSEPALKLLLRGMVCKYTPMLLRTKYLMLFVTGWLSIAGILLRLLSTQRLVYIARNKSYKRCATCVIFKHFISSYIMFNRIRSLVSLLKLSYLSSRVKQRTAPIFMLKYIKYKRLSIILKLAIDTKIVEIYQLSLRQSLTACRFVYEITCTGTWYKNRPSFRVKLANRTLCPTGGFRQSTGAPDSRY